MRSRNKVIVIVFLLLGAIAVACGARRAHHASRSPEQLQQHVSARVDRVLDDIDASDRQRAKVRQVEERLFTEFRNVHAASKPARAKALAEWRSERPDARALHALVDQRARDYTHAMHAMVDGMLSVHEALNPEQREEIARLIEERMGKH